MYTVDTNILIYYANGDEGVMRFLLAEAEKNTPFFLATIAVVEFFSFPAITPDVQTAYESLFPYCRIVPLDYTLSLKTAELRREHKALKLGDSVIAATAIHTNSVLLTRNIRDFKNIPNLKLLKI